MKKLLVVCILCISCSKNNDDNDVSISCTDEVGLYTITDFPIGVAVKESEIRFNNQYASIVENQFNSLTSENEFKPESIHPSQNFYYWDEIDYLLNYAEATNKRVHGHTLIWHNQLPQWILDYQGNSTDWELVMKNHIQTVMQHCQGKVASWDVVNEAFNEDGTLRNSIWKQKIGNDYIKKAFQFASEADPNALLFYNDYNLESNPTKRNSVIAYFNNLRAENCKVDGIGIQMHISILYPGINNIKSTMQQVSSNNYKVHLSELDISINPFGTQIDPTNLLLNQQAELLLSIVKEYENLPEENKFGITFWGVNDANSWIRSFFNRMDYPLLFNDTYDTKPCYCLLINYFSVN